MSKKLTIGEKLRLIRVNNDIPQQDVASDLFYSQATVSRHEHDRGEITVRILKMFCDYYGISLKDFFDGDYWDKEKYKKGNKK